MPISVESFEKTTGWKVEDTGSNPGYLDAGDQVKVGDSTIGYEEAVEAYYKMQSAPGIPDDPPPRPKTAVGTRSWEIGRALWPSQFKRSLEETKYTWPDLDIDVDDLGGWVSKTIALRVEGPEDMVNDYLRAIDSWVRRYSSSSY